MVRACGISWVNRWDMPGPEVFSCSEGVSKLSEGLGKAPESVCEGSRKRRTAHGIGCSESGTIVFLVETGES